MASDFGTSLYVLHCHKAIQQTDCLLLNYNHQAVDKTVPVIVFIGLCLANIYIALLKQ